MLKSDRGPIWIAGSDLVERFQGRRVSAEVRFGRRWHVISSGEVRVTGPREDGLVAVDLVMARPSPRPGMEQVTVPLKAAEILRLIPIVGQNHDFRYDGVLYMTDDEYEDACSVRGAGRPKVVRPEEADFARPSLLWWLIPGVLAGMSMPFIHQDRRFNTFGPQADYADELPALYAAGIRAVVCLLNIPSDAAIYESAGFAFKCLPVPNGGAPSVEQAQEFIKFVGLQLAEQHPVAVHCEAGLGRTGTMLATYLISQGDSAEQAIRRVRAAEGAAVETQRQIQFLEQFAAFWWSPKTNHE